MERNHLLFMWNDSGIGKHGSTVAINETRVGNPYVDHLLVPQAVQVGRQVSIAGSLKTLILSDRRDQPYIQSICALGAYSRGKINVFG